MKTPSDNPMTDEVHSRASAVASGWPGLVFVIGCPGFKTIGYSCLVLAGVGVAHHANFFGVIALLALGHFAICAAEVLADMEREDKARSANDKAQPRPDGRT